MSPPHVLPRDDDWQPSTTAELLDRSISSDQITQLAVRYALAVDSRNMDELVELFVDDVRVGHGRSGRDSLKEWMTGALAQHGRTIHLVANHILTFVDADHATGIVYCRDEVEHDGKWTLGHLQYWDTYERREGRWYFVRRRYNRWGVVDEVNRSESSLEGAGPTANELPQAWSSWHEFHAQLEEPDDGDSTSHTERRPSV